MNRPIKFRAWDKALVKMIQPKFIEPDLERNLNEYIAKIERDACILMQFTGLHDKNGKEIYEGDVVKDSAGDVLSISFQDGAFWFCYSPENRFTYDHAVKNDWWKPIEIVGNIYENPELIEKV